MLWAGAGVALGVASLLGLAHVHGTRPKGDFPHSAGATLAEPAVAAVAALAALILIAWGIRGLRLEFLAWWPGRIVVQNFVADQGAGAADIERLTTTFRDRLGVSHLQSPASVPAPAEQGDFLDVLGRGTVDPSNLAATLMTLMRAAVPTHAYEVTGALVTRDGPRSCGVTVHVVRLPGKGTGGHTVWDGTWEGAVRQAADHAAAAILPRTRECRSPWAAWRRYYMPPSLIENYERAAECEHERRYDEALAFYYRALDEDPMNYGLRLQVGFLQEKLGLFLDALDTYESILRVSRAEAHGRGDRTSRARLRKSYRRAARRDRDHTLLIARYRHAVLLGGPGLPHQWTKGTEGSPVTKRDEERERLRERLRPALRRRFAAAQEWARSADVVRDVDGDRSLARGDRRDAQLFVLASLHELERLRRRIPRVTLHRIPISRAATSVASLVVRERLRLVLDQQLDVPAFIAQVSRELSDIEGDSFEHWQEHYNAACIFALPLLNPEIANDDEVEELTRLAVDRLESASDCADSAYLVSRRDWVLSGDPDLQGLRPHPRFKRFEAAYFPSARRTPQRPREVQKWEVSRYTLDLVRAVAQRWEDTWAARASLRDLPADRVLMDWCRDEAHARRLIKDVALNHRDWDTRFELLRRMRKWSLEYGFEPVEVAFPDFARDSKIRFDDGDVERATREAIADKDLRLRNVMEQLAEDAPPARAPLSIETLCVAHSNLWRRLGELVSPAEERERATEALAKAVLETAAACRALDGDPGEAESPGGRFRSRGAATGAERSPAR